MGGARKTRRAQLKAMPVKTLRRMLKKLGYKTTGKKDTLVKRLNYAPRVGGGSDQTTSPAGYEGGYDTHGYNGEGYTGALARA